MTYSAKPSLGGLPGRGAEGVPPRGQSERLDVIEQSAHRLMVNLVVATLDLDRMARLDAVPYPAQARKLARELASYLCQSGYMSEDALADIHGERSEDDIMWIPAPRP